MSNLPTCCLVSCGLVVMEASSCPFGEAEVMILLFLELVTVDNKFAAGRAIIFVTSS